MTLYIGVDIHARQQTLAFLDTEDGTTGQIDDCYHDAVRPASRSPASASRIRADVKKVT
jgi:hypothetical protein